LDEDDNLTYDEDAEWYLDDAREEGFSEFCSVALYQVLDDKKRREQPLRSGMTERMPDSFIEQAFRGALSREDIREICSDLPDWTNSLHGTLSLAYQGTIPPEKISKAVPRKDLISKREEELEALIEEAFTPPS
jgi:hypothetical protein